MAERLLISGRVQGVGFRAFTQGVARDTGVRGWVRNLADGRVEAHLEGDGPACARVITALQTGPRFGRVDGIERAEVADTGVADFEIRR
ncbi:acylphosphatase [Maribius pontilimi]|uniref:Acylphosphatase n=1 Tax=Palleronia pontilimi TaxID=1964209 RepID=A0A934ID02_9RHOB|nr:acylphosphatase [Palleronia pontilimi]MBJ3763386.1 acylphosphatase [Palleronia pontilimi]